jgi:hypothetical protein
LEGGAVTPTLPLLHRLAGALEGELNQDHQYHHPRWIPSRLVAFLRDRAQPA